MNADPERPRGSNARPVSETGEHTDQSDDTAQRHRAYIRKRILHHHLERALREASISEASARISQGLALNRALEAAASRHGDDARISGGLSADDLAKMAPVPPRTLGPVVLEKLEDELKTTLHAIAAYYSPDTADVDDVGGLHAASQLPDRIRRQQDAVAQQRASLQQCRARVLHLVEQINDTHPALEAQLVSALETLPGPLRATRAAQADVLAATIEAALLKLLLLRARAQRALYSLAPPGAPERTVARAVRAAYDALCEKRAAQDEETRRLDGEIETYEGVLSLVDGGRRGEGAFAQVVRDMARVRRETEECRRDLRRLGWTGD